MSTENLNEILNHQTCHTDDILEHIDNESQQEYMEKIAPKAQEEILTINQDCDSSPTDDVNTQSVDENNKEYHVENEISESKFSPDEQMNENNHDIMETESKQEATDVEGYMEESVDYEDYLNLLDNTKIIEHNNESEEAKIDLSEKSQLNQETVGEQKHTSENMEDSCKVEEATKNEENLERFDMKESQDIATNVSDEIKINNELPEDKSVENEFVEPDKNEEHVMETVVNDEMDLNETCNVDSTNNIQNVEDTSISIQVDPFEISKDKFEKVSKDNKTKDVKALSSTYSNDDNVNSDCEICKRTVYPLEKLSANNRIFHKLCFKCTKCRCALLAANFSFNNDKPYCRPHYIELFKKRGRYDEIDDGETTTQQTTINDILTDELPAPDITKNLVAKFRDLESGTGSAASVHASNSEGTDELPAPNTTKNLMERFSALSKDNDRESKRKPMIDIPRSGENGHSSEACENQPITLPKDVARANDPSHDEMPEQGITKNLVNRFRDLESTGVASK